MEFTKEIAQKWMQRDFIPDGEKVEIHPLKFRSTAENEVYQCCCGTGRTDSQSGEFFCGAIAKFIMDVKNEKEEIVGVFALCGKGSHMPFKCGKKGKYVSFQKVVKEQ